MSDPQSPCIGVCQLDASHQLCVGCGRTLAEIGGWATADADEQRAICERAAERLKTSAQTAQQAGED